MKEWRDVCGYENIYKVSNDGEIWSILSGRKLKPYLSPQGYEIVSLWKDSKPTKMTVHRIVATVFLDNPDGKPEVNHIDGNKTNNKVENLEWVTKSENMKHAFNNGLCNMSSALAAVRNMSKEKRHEKAVKAGKKTAKKIIRDDGVVYKSIHEAAEKNGCGAGSICGVLSGRRNTVKGHVFSYLEGKR